MRRLGSLFALLAAAALVAGCGGGGGGGTTPQAVNRGVITALGSIFVNGVEFNTTGASITMDDHSAHQTSLMVGMVVSVEGEWNTSTRRGTATAVIFKDDLQGPISTIDRTAGTFAVLGQTVKVDSGTRFDNTTGLAGASPLAVNDLVEVSGLPDGTGALRATFVERKTPDQDTELKGVVVGMPGSGTFQFHTSAAPTVTYTVLFTGSLPAGISSGSRVEVKVSSFNSSTMTITASQVKLEGMPGLEDKAKVEMEGFVTSFVSNASFMVNGTPVNASGITGLTGMANGMRVEIEGTMSGATLMASKISFQGSGQGVISGFGSVIINGVEYDTLGANITREGASATASTLSAGMVVRFRADTDPVSGKGIATDVMYADDLKGVLQTKDLAAGTFVVMGVTVQVSASTIFEHAANLAALAVGDVVEVSGNTDAAGIIHATYVERKGPGSEMEIKGTVTAWTPDTTTFSLALPPPSTVVYTVNFSGMASSLPAGFGVGAFVEVKASAFDPATMTITASLVHLEDSPEPCDGEQAQVSGLVSGWSSTTQTFDISGISVDVSAITPAGIMNGVKVEVEGPMVNGVLDAVRVQVEREESVEVEGSLTAVDPAAGTLTVMGTTFTTSVTTIFKDQGPSQMMTLTLSALALNDHLSVAGYPTASGYAAVKVERKEASAQAMMMGPVSAYSNTTPWSLTLLGQVVPVDPLTTRFADIAGTTIDAPSFFAAITTPRTIVSVSWDAFSNMAAPANEAEIDKP